MWFNFISFTHQNPNFSKWFGWILSAISHCNWHILVAVLQYKHQDGTRLQTQKELRWKWNDYILWNQVIECFSKPSKMQNTFQALCVKLSVITLYFEHSTVNISSDIFVSLYIESIFYEYTWTDNFKSLYLRMNSLNSIQVDKWTYDFQ